MCARCAQSVEVEVVCEAGDSSTGIMAVIRYPQSDIEQQANNTATIRQPPPQSVQSLRQSTPQSPPSPPRLF